MKRNLSVLFLLLLAVQMMAGPVSRQEALQAAQQFLSKRGVKAPGLKERMRAPMKGEVQADAAAYYIFNVGDSKGFVVVSGDDRTEAVLGYTLSGDFDEATMPDNMRAWLQGYADQISAMNADERALGYDPADIDGGTPARSYSPLMKSVATHDAVAPFITTKWNQRNPYNDSCPMPSAGAEDECVTGCVATAMAQIMNYFKYPENLPEIGSYTTATSLIYVSPLLGIDAFPWDELKDTYGSGETDKYVADLMRYCGQSVKMNYTANSSSANISDAAVAWKTLFGYKSASSVNRSQYSSKGWDELIYDELKNSRPVLYAGQSSGGGHAFVCDGYDGDGYYHINWGWGGYQDGYFMLQALNPAGGGIGASSTSDGYNFGQDAVINIKTNEETPEIIKTNIYALSYDNDKSEFSVSYHNLTGSTYSFDFGFGYLEGSDVKCCVKVTENYSLPNTYYTTYSIPLADFNGMDDGIYRVVPISKKNGTTEWYNCYNNDEYYAEISVSGGVASFVAMHPIEDYTASINEPSVKLYEKSPNKISVTFTNNSPDVFEKQFRLYYTVGGTTYSTTSLGGVSVAAGKTETVEFVFNPKHGAGTYNVQIKDYSSTSFEYCSKELTVEALPSGDYKNTVSNPRFVGGVSPRFEVEIRNDNDFEQPARAAKVAFYYKNKDLASDSYYPKTADFNIAEIPAGGTITATYSLSGIMHSDWTEIGVNTSCHVMYLYDNGQNTWGSFDISSTPTVTLYAAQVSSFGYATYAKNVALDFSECEGLTAYTGTLKTEGGSQVLQMTEQTQVPANTGLVLKGTPHVTYAAKKIDSAPTITGNDLTAVTSDATVDANSVLVLASVGGEVGFYNYTGTAIAAGHAYLSKSKISSARPVRIDWEGGTTGIGTVHETATTPTATFNIAGQRVAEDYKGIVIKNGRKYLQK